MTLGERIKTAREAMDMTQEELGKICGVKKQTIFKYENNIITNIPFNKLKLISRGLKVSVPKLMDWETEDGGIDLGIAQYETGLSEDEVENLISTPASQDALKKDLSEKEKDHIKKFRSLDPYGKEAVDGVLDVEFRRCEAARKEQLEQATDLREQRGKMEAGELLEVETLCFMVPWFFQPMGAGPGETAGSEAPEDLRLTKAPPRGTSFVARVHGVSMEPTYHDGDLVFVHSAEEIQVGRIGAFFMDGQQWIKELGDEELISHNPGYNPIPMREDIRCQGLVLGVCDESYFE